ncbi:MAG: hypothetical protein WDO24_23485 [Pseudomonadota bacterium]
MLTIADTPTIRHAILKRLDREPGVTVLGVYVKPFAGCIGVGIETLLRDLLVTRSHFRLPVEFALNTLHNEIDQIAEQLKAAWRAHTGTVRSDQTEAAQLAGTGRVAKDG